MKYIVITILITCTSCYGLTTSQQKLVNLRKKELIELNTALIKNKKKLEELKDKDVYVKAKLIDKENGKYKIVVSDITLNNPENNPENNSGTESEYLYIKGKLINNDNSDFKLDIKYVLPKEKNTSKVDNNSNK